jgi:hypothetical protein
MKSVRAWRARLRNFNNSMLGLQYTVSTLFDDSVHLFQSLIMCEPNNPVRNASDWWLHLNPAFMTSHPLPHILALTST